MGLCPVNGTAAIESDSVSASQAQVPLTNTVLLSFRSLPSTAFSWNLPANPQTQPFAKEPVLGNTVTRGIFFTNQAPSNTMAYIWDQSKGRLYLDLNRNGDLTDDPAGTFTNTYGYSTYYQVFPKVNLTFATSHGWHSCQIDLNISNYKSSSLNMFAAVQSAWVGEMQLEGKSWVVAVLDNQVVSGGSFKNFCTMSVRPIEEKERLFQSDGDNMNRSTFSLPLRLCLDGRVYRWSLAFEGQDDSARLAATMTEESVPMGELQVGGTLIDELDLEGDFAVFLHSPKPSVKVPAGKYQHKQVFLKAPGSKITAGAQVNNGFVVATNKPLVLNIGGPLDNNVDAQRQGNLLVLNYKLTGAGGQKFTLNQQDRNKPPQFAIYQGDKKLHSGAFEFG